MDISISAIIAQILNFLVIFFLFRKYLAKPIADTIQERRDLIKKVSNADIAYDNKMKEADIKVRELIEQGVNKKDNIIAEAGFLADKKQNEIIGYAKEQAEKIENEAKNKAMSIERELEDKFAESVKTTSLLVVKKLIKKDKDIKSDYVEEAIKEMGE